jgi:hypothetical protein
LFNRITIAAVQALCAKYKVPLEWALGLAEVESAGRAFWTVNGRPEPAIRPEGHYFDRLLHGADQKKARNLGLANPKAGAVKVPGNFEARYRMLEAMRAIDDTAALMSISMGVGQVMGAHYDRLGFDTVQEMWQTARTSLAGQIELMLRFITTDRKIVAAIAANDYATVAKLYNGPNFRVNKYDAKIKKAVETWRAQGSKSYGAPAQDFTEEKQAIAKLGFPTVKAFQQAVGLNADGIIGPITRDAIEEAAKIKVTKPRKEAGKLAGVAGTVTTVAAVATQTQGVVDTARPTVDFIKDIAGSYGPTVAAVLIAAIVVGTIAYIVTSRKQHGVPA